MRKNALIIIALIAAAALGMATINIPKVEAAAPKLAISKVYNVNQTDVTILVNITVTDAVEMFGWIISFSWDPNFIKINTGDPNGLLKNRVRYNIYEGDFLQNKSATSFLVNTIDNKKGEITFLSCYFSTTWYTITGSGRLASIEFNVMSVGTTAINITGPSVQNPGHSVLLDLNGIEIAHDDVNGLVTDQPPPPPPPFWTESWFQTLIAAVVVVVILPTGIITGIIVRLRRAPPVSEEDLEKIGEFDEEIKGIPLPEDSE